MLLKINGERNSGTNFLKEILDKNGFPTYDQEIRNNIVFDWKHGIPSENIKLKNEKIINLFIFRNLEEWLISMFYNPYHIKQIDNFYDFLINPQQSCEDYLLNEDTNKFLNEDDNNKTIFEIRYYKFNKILNYKLNNNDIIFVNLNFLQDENNLIFFLKKLNNLYFNFSIEIYKTQLSHTKDSNIEFKNRIYSININDYKYLINEFQNEEIENFISNLTYEIN